MARISILALFLFFSFGSAAFAQCGVNIPDGELCEAPGGSNCEFYMCVAGACVPSGTNYVPGTKCGCFADECYEDFCDASGDCVCGFFAAGPTVKCASEQNICNGVEHCDGVSGRNCDGTTEYPAAACDDGVACTHDCNPASGCATYPINARCDDADICTTDICDTTGVTTCTNICSGLAGCNTHPACSGSLPVEIANFSVNAKGTNLDIEWMTSTEFNNEGFDIELSLDGSVFVKSGFVPGSGTSNEAQFYTFTTPILDFGLNYVRLKQIDVDGDFTYSRTLVVKTELNSPLVLEPAFPNPFHSATTIRFSVALAGDASLKVYDQYGKLVKVLHNGATQSGRNYSYTLDASELSAGMYFYELSNEYHTLIRKLSVY